MPKFLIYSMFVSNEVVHWTMASSVIIDSAESEDEAMEKIRVFKERSDSCSVSRGHSVYRYLPNSEL